LPAKNISQTICPDNVGMGVFAGNLAITLILSKASEDDWTVGRKGWATKGDVCVTWVGNVK
jgi:hypothetical protein